MARVDAKPHESFERLMTRFKRAVEKSGVLKDVHEREFFERPGETRKKARAAAKARLRKRLEIEQLEINQRRLAHRTPGGRYKYEQQQKKKAESARAGSGKYSDERQGIY